MDKKTIKNVIFPMLLGVLLYYILSLIFHPYIISGSSMEPTFHDNQLVLCDKIKENDEISYGDIVVLKDNTWWRYLIKRVVALPGDEVDIKDGFLYVNGELSDYQFDYIKEIGSLSYPLELASGEYFCMGDNRNDSRDCRDIGPVTKNNIRYKVTKSLFYLGGNK
jgi:signal peptidase I